MQLEDICHLKSRDLLEIPCGYCGSSTKKLVKAVRESIKLGTTLCCTTECVSKYLSSISNTSIDTSCYTCGKDISVSQSVLKERNYCSKTCAATTNNKLYPKRVKEIISCNCGREKRKNSKQCRKCKDRSAALTRRYNLYNKTLGEIRNHYIKDKAQRLGSISHTIATVVRKAARDLASLEGRPKVCQYCGYDTYVELCHIKPLSEFSDEAILGEINGKENTVYLCPNHHKELDLGILVLTN